MSVNARTGLSDKRDDAKRLLLHYFNMAATGKAPAAENDCITEVCEIVDLIVNAALEEITAAMARVRVPQ